MSNFNRIPSPNEELVTDENVPTGNWYRFFDGYFRVINDTADVAPAIAALSAGYIVKTSGSAYAARTITANSSKIAITNGSGAGGNTTIDVTESSLTLDNLGGTLATTKGGTGLTTYTLGDTLYCSASNVISKLSGNTTATLKVLTQTGDGVSSAAPVWNTVAVLVPGAALTKVDDTNVTLTLGGSPTTALVNASSITVGWSGTLSSARGGTGVNNGSSTITIGGNFEISGAFTFTGAVTGNTSVTFPTSGTLVNSAVTTLSSLTSIGTIGTGVWQGTVVGMTYGGTGANITPSNGGIVYSNATTLAVLAGTATAGQVLLSGASTTPSWSTPTYPSASGTAGKVLRSDGTNNVYSTSTFADTYTASNILYSNGSNTVTGLATANNGVLITSGAGVPSISSNLPTPVQNNINLQNFVVGSANGQIPIYSSSGGNYLAANITAGTGITITNGSNTISISALSGTDYYSYTYAGGL